MPFNFALPSKSRLTTPRDPNVPKGVEDPNEALMSKDYLDWFADLSIFVAGVPNQVINPPITLTNQSGSIVSTPVPIGSVSEGLYRVSYYAAVTTPATTSSSLIVAIEFPDDAVNKSFTGAAMTGNTVATVQSNSYLMFVDAAGPIEYSTTYASVGATAMVYKLYVTVERVGVA